MLSVDEFTTKMKKKFFVKCENVDERSKCIELLDELGFDGDPMFRILKTETGQIICMLES